MKILICPDKFKGSLTAAQVCDAAESGLRKKYPDAEITKLPLADGGEGTTGILTEYLKGIQVRLKVHGPLFEEVEAVYGTAIAQQLAFIEMSGASGLQLLKQADRNPLNTTTLGTGELIRHAIDHGATKIALGIGGSATNDAGIGMASALGYKFFDRNGMLLKPIGRSLVDIDRIEVPEHRIDVIALCDVDNPLFGPNGAAFVYGPQKGASPEDVELLDRGLRNFEKVARKTFGRSADFPGAGAGGGIAGGASVFFNLSVRRGIDFVMGCCGAYDKIREADLIVTGEGKIDRQSLAGKVVGAVAKHAQAHQKPVIALCGVCELRKNEMEKIGVSEVISLVDIFTTPEEAIRNAAPLIAEKLATFTP